MPSMKVVKRRITSVRSTQKITKAMDLVANAKHQKAKTRLEASRRLFNETREAIERISNRVEVEDNRHIKPPRAEHALYIVITGDRGMCGAYNANITHAVMALIEKKGKGEMIITLGSKGWEYFRRRRKNIIKRYFGRAEASFYQDAEEISRFVRSLYKNGEIDEVYVAYTQFESMLSQMPKVVKVYPVGGDSDMRHSAEMMGYDSDANTVLDYLAPLYLEVFVYNAIVESSVSEQAARMVSMDAATNNADEIIDDLTVMYNRMRQTAITQELNEIVNGANALN